MLLTLGVLRLFPATNHTEVRKVSTARICFPPYPFAMSTNTLTSAQRGICAAAQDGELDALESTYGEQMFKRDSFGTRCVGAKFVFHTRLPNGKINVKINAPASLNIEPETFQVENLPSLQLDVLFPVGYPELQKPRFLLKCHWLPPGDLTKVCAKLDDIWSDNEGMPVVYLWVDFLENELLNFLGTYSIAQNVCRPDFPRRERGNRMFDARARTIYLSPKRITSFLKDVNLSRKRELFENNFLTCSICYNNMYGREMTMFTPCDHAFCHACTSTHFITQINDGCPNGLLSCMQPECTSEARFDQVRCLVGEELFQKYDRLLLDRYFNSRSDITSCPREHCDAPVIIETASTIATCGACGFTFCLMCRRPSHGINVCETQNTEQLAQRYMQATPNERALLERKFSKRYLSIIVNEFQSKDWIRENAKKCPKCQIYIQKSEGCNKIQCWKCNTKFCYLCGRSLDHLADPYLHYNDLTNECHNRLFEAAMNDDEVDEDFDDGDGDDIEFGLFEHIDLAAL
ncbi:E3 ubiquitin-protein ligase RNF14-like [Tropilaelaps mercedesae]|uniref:RBR-type E3 ubiquitin transferase n=1 Tax=Tropilaelaps mercedesae TaxID=418985 RepID=A0A1V9X611_9ACAR|nr:E3 ubiquitin-protein ligase RNF14-like [Tropilaelaps mercedesae]